MPVEYDPHNQGLPIRRNGEFLQDNPMFRSGDIHVLRNDEARTVLLQQVHRNFAYFDAYFHQVPENLEQAIYEQMNVITWSNSIADEVDRINVFITISVNIPLQENSELTNVEQRWEIATVIDTAIRSIYDRLQNENPNINLVLSLGPLTREAFRYERWPGAPPMTEEIDNLMHDVDRIRITEVQGPTTITRMIPLRMRDNRSESLRSTQDYQGLESQEASGLQGGSETLRRTWGNEPLRRTQRNDDLQSWFEDFVAITADHSWTPPRQPQHINVRTITGGLGSLDGLSSDSDDSVTNDSVRHRPEVDNRPEVD